MIAAFSERCSGIAAIGVAKVARDLTYIGWNRRCSRRIPPIGPRPYRVFGYFSDFIHINTISIRHSLSAYHHYHISVHHESASLTSFYHAHSACPFCACQSSAGVSLPSSKTSLIAASESDRLAHRLEDQKYSHIVPASLFKCLPCPIQSSVKAEQRISGTSLQETGQ